MSEMQSTVVSVIEKILQYKKYLGTVKNTLDPSALSTMAKNTTVEPFCVISRDCANLDYIQDVNNSLLNMFIAYYLQAFNNIIKLNDIRVKKMLNAVGTNVSFIEESHSTNMDLLNFKLPNSSNLSLENNTSVPSDHRLIGTQSGKNQPDLETYSNLAVGKLIELQFTLDSRYDTQVKHRVVNQKDTTTSGIDSSVRRDPFVNKHGDVQDNTLDTVTTTTKSPVTTTGGSNTKEDQIFFHEGQVFTIPVLIKLLVNIVPSSTIENLLVRYKDDISFGERWMAWKAGRITFWRDLVLCQDLINENKRNLIKDESGVASAIDERVRNAIELKLSNIAWKTMQKKDIKTTDSYSFGVASNLYVITSTEAAKIEYALRGKLSNPAIRAKLFGNGYAMILTVIDPDRERVKFYINGADGYTDLSVREIKSASKNKGPDINDMLKMLQMGMSPTF